MAPPIQCCSSVQVGTSDVPKAGNLGRPRGPIPHLHIPTPSPGDGWLLKAVSLGTWIHMVEELQVFDQEPVESLVLSQSKVARRATRTSLCSTVCLAPNLSAFHSWSHVIGQRRTPSLSSPEFLEVRDLRCWNLSSEGPHIGPFPVGPPFPESNLGKFPPVFVRTFQVGLGF